MDCLSNKIYQKLKSIHPHLKSEEIKITKIDIEMIPAKHTKPLQNVYVYDKRKPGETFSKVEKFDWEGFRHTIKPNL